MSQTSIFTCLRTPKIDEIIQNSLIFLWKMATSSWFSGPHRHKIECKHSICVHLSLGSFYSVRTYGGIHPSRTLETFSINIPYRFNISDWFMSIHLFYLKWHFAGIWQHTFHSQDSILPGWPHSYPQHEQLPLYRFSHRFHSRDSWPDIRFGHLFLYLYLNILQQ